MPPEFVPTTRGQQERLEAQIGRRGSTRGRSDQDPRGMYGPREQTGTVTADLGGGRTQEVAVYGGPTQQINTGFDFGTGEKAGTLSQQEFMNITGRTETNPYGKQGFYSRALGIDPSNINYATIMPGGIAAVSRVNALAYDQYLNPRDARGNIRGFLREGSPTRFGTVTYDPTLEKDLGIMGALPLVGPLMQRANRRSALNISSYDNPLFSDMSDMGNELGAFPEVPVPPSSSVIGYDYDPTVPLVEPLPADLFDISQVPPAPPVSRASTSIPTAKELRGDRINRLVAELKEATAEFPEQYEVAPTASSIPSAYELTKAAGIDFPPRILPKSVMSGDEMNVNMSGLF